MLTRQARGSSDAPAKRAVARVAGACPCPADSRAKEPLEGRESAQGKRQHPRARHISRRSSPKRLWAGRT
jgi:hypothetical protein